MNIQELELRDYFAGQALAGISERVSTHPAFGAMLERSGIDPTRFASVASSICYELADAMMAEREKGHK